jgi:hypothetical protein
MKNRSSISNPKIKCLIKRTNKKLIIINHTVGTKNLSKKDVSELMQYVVTSQQPKAAGYKIVNFYTIDESFTGTKTKLVYGDNFSSNDIINKLNSLVDEYGFIQEKVLERINKIQSIL